MQRPRIAFLPLVLGVVVLMGLAACNRTGPPEVGEADTSPMDPVTEQWLYQGTQALQNHNFVQALAYVDSAEARSPHLADVPFLRGRIYAELVRLDDAKAAYRQALDMRPTYPGAWNNLGNTAFREQEYTEAINYYHRELATNPDPRPWRGIARAYVELGETDSARYAFDQALAMDSTFAQAHFGKALLLDDLGDPEGALQAVQRALSYEPDNLEYQYYVGSYLVKLGRPDEALALLEAVAEEWPWHQGAHYNLGQALMRLGRTEEAEAMQARAEKLRHAQAQISHLENTARVQPENPAVHAMLGSALRRVGRYNDAMHAYKVALYFTPGDLEIRNNVAVLHLLRRDTTASIQAFEQIVRVDDSFAHAWLNLGSLYAMSGEFGKARRAWEKVLEHDPGNESAPRLLASLPPVE